MGIICNHAATKEVHAVIYKFEMSQSVTDLKFAKSQPYYTGAI